MLEKSAGSVSYCSVIDDATLEDLKRFDLLCLTYCCDSFKIRLITVGLCCLSIKAILIRCVHCQKNLIILQNTKTVFFFNAQKQ